LLSIEFGGGFVYLSSTLRAQAHERGAGGRADPPPPLLETKNQLDPLPEMPRIFSFRLQWGGEGAPCGRGQGSHGQSARVGRQV